MQSSFSSQQNFYSSSWLWFYHSFLQNWKFLNSYLIPGSWVSSKNNWKGCIFAEAKKLPSNIFKLLPLAVKLLKMQKMLWMCWNRQFAGFNRNSVHILQSLTTIVYRTSVIQSLQKEEKKSHLEQLETIVLLAMKTGFGDPKSDD